MFVNKTEIYLIFGVCLLNLVSGRVSFHIFSAPIYSRRSPLRILIYDSECSCISAAAPDFIFGAVARLVYVFAICCLGLPGHIFSTLALIVEI